MLKILSFDTSLDACSAALLINGEVYERFQIAPRRHNELILPMINELLLEAGISLHELSTIAFGAGPGSFTGIRLAASIAQGLAFGANLSVVRVSTLHAIAETAHEKFNVTKVLVALDARVQEVYFGAYELDSSGFMRPVSADLLLKPESLILPQDLEKWCCVGNGWDIYRDILPQDGRINTIETNTYPRAGVIAKLGKEDFLRNLQVAPEYAIPVYLRDEKAWKQSGDK